MLGGLARNSFVAPDHLIELKWDGLRALGGTAGPGLGLGLPNRTLAATVRTVDRAQVHFPAAED